MSYTVRLMIQYAVINNDNGLPIAVCKDKDEARAIINMMAGHGRSTAKPYTFSDWASKQ